MKMNRFYSYLIGITFIGTGIFSFLDFRTPSKVSGWIEPSFYNTASSIIIGLSFFVYGFYKKEKKERYTKCPKCKESFSYIELKDGKCKYCENVDSIEIDEYYKKYPEELKDI